MDYYVRKVLDERRLEQVKQSIEICNQNGSWQDGLLSGGGIKSVKNNLEMSDVQQSNIINSMIMNSLDVDKDFINFTAAKSTALNIVSKTISGGYYNPHLDSWFNGDYSTTVFLNDPEEYNGGELCLYCGGEDEVKIKLKAGWGVTYSTGIVHRVNRIISGVRYVSVFWTESLIKDSFMRYVYNELSKIENINLQNNQSVHLSDCISASKDPDFCVRNLKTQILRKYGHK